MKTKFLLGFGAVLAMLVFSGGIYAGEPRCGDTTSANVLAPKHNVITCNVCKMHGSKDVDLARHQRTLAKATGKEMCPNCAGLAMAAKFHKDGTIFQGEHDFVCSGCDKGN